MLAILQFDALNRSFVDQLLGEGRLPTLAGLVERGEWRSLKTPASHFAGATQPTHYSGIELGTHAQHYLLQWSPQEQRIRFRRSFEFPEPTWERLARAGRRTLMIDPYEGHLPPQPVGVVASGVQFRNYLGLEPWTSPRAAGRTIDRLVGRRRPYVEEVFGRPHVPSLLALRRRLAEAPGRLADAAVGLLAESSFNLIWLTFLSCHIGGHQFWNLSQLDEDALDAPTKRILEGTLGELYEGVDHALGRVLNALPDDADLIIDSPLGMGENTSRADFLGQMLDAVIEGRIEPKRSASVPLWRLRAAMPTQVRGRITRTLGPALSREVMARASVAGVDWSRTRAFVLPSDHHGQVRLNLRGRERDGIVDPGEAEELCERIATGLLTFRDLGGGPAIAGVDRIEDIVGADAPARPLLPDLLVRWTETPSTRLEAVVSPEYGQIERAGQGSGRPGGHTAEAWALLVPGRSRIAIRSGDEDVLDVAATACALLGGDMAGLAGTPLLEL